MVLRELDQAAHAGDVDHGRGVAGHVLAALCEQTEEGGGDEEDREGVDVVEAAPALEGLALEERTADRIRRLAVRVVGIFEPWGDGSGLSSAVRVVSRGTGERSVAANGASGSECAVRLRLTYSRGCGASLPLQRSRRVRQQCLGDQWHP